MKNNIKIIKVNPQNILPINEAWAATAGFSTSPDYGNPAFSYEIKPLSFTLCQKGNDPEMLNKNKSFKFFVGDHVSGYCPYDGKKHEGMIKYFYWVPGSDGTMPKFVYIQDFSNEDTIPLEADSIKQTLTRYTPNDLAVKDYYRARDTEIAHDYGATEMPKNVFESNNINPLINYIIQESTYLKGENDIGVGLPFSCGDLYTCRKLKLIDFSPKNFKEVNNLLNFKLPAIKNTFSLLSGDLLIQHFMRSYVYRLFEKIKYEVNKNKFSIAINDNNIIGIIYNDCGKTYILYYNTYNYKKGIINNIIHCCDGMFDFITKNFDLNENFSSNIIKIYKNLSTEKRDKNLICIYDPQKYKIVSESFDFNSNRKTLNEQYAYLNEARVIAKKFIEGKNFDFNNLNESILEEYGLLYIFALNEGETSNMFQKFKQPLINAFNKIKSKFGDKSCRHIADIIKKAQAKGKGALYGILTIITLLSSTLSANAKTTPKFYNNLKQNVEIAVANMADAQNISNYEFSDFAESEYYKFAKLFLSLDSEKFARYCGSGVGYSEIEQNAINMAYSDALQYVKQQYGENAINDYGLKFEIVKQSSSVQTINGGITKSYYTVVVVVYQDVPPPPINEVFDFNFNGKTLNEQYAYLNEARVMAKKFFEDNFDLKPAKGFSFKQYVDKSTGAYVTTEPFDGKPTGTMKFFAKHGISKVYNGSIGFSEKEQKWYGWSHRAIYGFGIGSKVKKGDCGYKGKAWTAKTLDDAKQMAKDFADAVS